MKNIGQSFFGEELIYMVVAVLALAFVMIISLKQLGDTEMQSAKIDAYRLAQTEADKVAAQLAWKTGDGTVRMRVIDYKNPAISCSEGVGVCSRNLRNGATKVLCPGGGDPCADKPSNDRTDLVLARVAIPVAIKKGYEYDPGLLIVTVK